MNANKTIEIKEVIERLKKMKPEVNLLDFDNSKKNDPYYCVEWGRDKQKWVESLIYQKYIDKLESLLTD